MKTIKGVVSILTGGWVVLLILDKLSQSSATSHKKIAIIRVIGKSILFMKSVTMFVLVIVNTFMVISLLDKKDIK